MIIGLLVLKEVSLAIGGIPEEMVLIQVGYGGAEEGNAPVGAKGTWLFVGIGVKDEVDGVFPSVIEGNGS